MARSSFSHSSLAVTLSGPMVPHGPCCLWPRVEGAMEGEGQRPGTPTSELHGIWQAFWSPVSSTNQSVKQD